MSADLVPSILCVDDEPNILASLKRLFRSSGYQVKTAGGGAEGLALLEAEPIDLVISDMRMPNMDGTEFLQKVKERWPDTMRLLLTGYSEVNSIIGAINRGEIYRYIAKPWDDNDIVLIVRQALERKALEHEKQRLEALTQAQNLELQALNASLELKVQERTEELSLANISLVEANSKLKNHFVTSIKMFSILIEMRGGNLAGHSRRVADLCQKLALKLGLNEKEAQEIFVAGLLHEIGKIGFSDDLLNTPVGAMSQEQLHTYRKHIVQAEHLLMPLQDLKGAAHIICKQFERFDGTGFPGKLFGEAIPIGARILNVASDFDGMQIGTMAKRRLTQGESKTIIVHGRGSRYDPAVVDALVEIQSGDIKDADQQTAGERIVLYKDLAAGMVLSRDLLAPNGLLMLTKGHALTDELIQKMVNYERFNDVELSVHIWKS